MLLRAMAPVIGYASWRWWCSAGLDAAATESELEWQVRLSLHQLVPMEMASRLQKQQERRRAVGAVGERQAQGEEAGHEQWGCLHGHQLFLRHSQEGHSFRKTASKTLCSAAEHCSKTH